MLEILKHICLLGNQNSNFNRSQSSLLPVLTAYKPPKFLPSLMVSQGMLVLIWALEVRKRTTGRQLVHSGCHPHNISLGLTIGFLGGKKLEGENFCITALSSIMSDVAPYCMFTESVKRNYVWHCSRFKKNSKSV